MCIYIERESERAQTQEMCRKQTLLTNKKDAKGSTSFDFPPPFPISLFQKFETALPTT